MGVEQFLANMGIITTTVEKEITVVNAPPVAEFTVPDGIYTNFAALFDASGSYDPDGEGPEVLTLPGPRLAPSEGLQGGEELLDGNQEELRCIRRILVAIEPVRRTRVVFHGFLPLGTHGKGGFQSSRSSRAGSGGGL